MARSQANRIIAITAPLGKDVLLLKSLSGAEQWGWLPWMEATRFNGPRKDRKLAAAGEFTAPAGYEDVEPGHPWETAANPPAEPEEQAPAAAAVPNGAGP